MHLIEYAIVKSTIKKYQSPNNTLTVNIKYFPTTPNFAIVKIVNTNSIIPNIS